MFVKKLNAALSAALAQAGITEPTALQKLAIPRIKSGADLVCIAPEGLGKSTALVIGVIQRLTAALNDVPRALVIVDSKEKAIEIKEIFDILGKGTDLRVVCSDLDRKIEDQRDKIYKGCDVVVGTAKRMNELYSFSGLNLNDLKLFVVDDAELVMRQLITSQIDRLAGSIPKAQQLVFANQLTDRIDRYIDMFMSNPEVLDIDLDQESEE